MRIPVATYRLQFHPEFKFQDALRILTYLDDLGISDIYASPIFKARRGSTHGYDVVDPSQLNPELGSDEDFAELTSDLSQRGMGWLQDIVPNHMAYDSENPFLVDILEHGPYSEYSDFFDVEWEHPFDDFKGKILIPMLGDFYGRCMERGEITLNYDENGLTVNYYDLWVPLRIESYNRFLTHDMDTLAKSLGRNHPDFVKLLGILYMVKNLSEETTGRERKDQAQFIKELLWELYTSNEDVHQFIQKNLALFNGEIEEGDRYELLDSLLSDQFFRLAFWKVGAEELNYRRFFTVNELICLRIEDLKVFQKTHSLISQLIKNGQIQGLRIDHLDGLYNPKQYLRRLRTKCGEDTYIVIEKILEIDEELPDDWPIQGTSGYDFLNQLNGLFCCRANEKAFDNIYGRLVEQRLNYQAWKIDNKRLIADTNLVGDVDNLAHRLKRIAGRYRYGRDFTLSGLRKSILEMLVQFPVYCTYINEEGVSERDRAYIREAIKNSNKCIPQLQNELTFIEKVLTLDYEDFLTEEDKTEWLHFSMRFQQFSGPLMAKGVEDTLFYVYNRMISLNEVGGDPGKFGITPKEFHSFNQRQLAHWPHTLNTTSTHDTKRSEDVRARLNVLSEIPEEWDQQVRRWQNLNDAFKIVTEKRTIPDPNNEYFLYQTLVGAFPFESASAGYQTFVDRVKAYVVKAVREAKVYTAWLRPDSEYEEGFVTFVERILKESEQNDFLADFRPFQQKIARYGIFNSLSQTLLKLTSPGVPDCYQGTELWDLSLVDPDNRRPVDYEERISFLQEIQRRCQTDINSLLSDLQATWQDGRMKLFLIYRALKARKQYRDIFEKGNYTPLKVEGKYAENIVAFARTHQKQTAIVVVPRFLTGVIQPDQEPYGEKVWGDTVLVLPKKLQADWLETITEREIPDQSRLSVGKILQNFPVALLLKADLR
jgi:(1->4)-alpha-D-glucan 1-alpha-D-glucosylmutase